MEKSGHPESCLVVVSGISVALRDWHRPQPAKVRTGIGATEEQPRCRPLQVTASTLAPSTYRIAASSRMTENLRPWRMLTGISDSTFDSRGLESSQRTLPPTVCSRPAGPGRPGHESPDEVKVHDVGLRPARAIQQAAYRQSSLLGASPADRRLQPIRRAFVHSRQLEFGIFSGEARIAV